MHHHNPVSHLECGAGFRLAHQIGRGWARGLALHFPGGGDEMWRALNVAGWVGDAGEHLSFLAAVCLGVHQAGRQLDGVADHAREAAGAVAAGPPQVRALVIAQVPQLVAVMEVTADVAGGRAGASLGVTRPHARTLALLAYSWVDALAGLTTAVAPFGAVAPGRPVTVLSALAPTAVATPLLEDVARDLLPAHTAGVQAVDLVAALPSGAHVAVPGAAFLQ